MDCPACRYWCRDFIAIDSTLFFRFSNWCGCNGFNLQTFYSPHSCSSSEDEEASSTTKTLYVGNLPYKANESHVKELFAEFGEVFAVRLMKDKRTGKRRGFGFVVIAASQAQTAIDALNEKEYMQRTLKVRIANDPKSDEEMAEQD